MTPFILFWHRTGNTPAGVAAVLQLTRQSSLLAGREVAHGVELDLKWTQSGEDLLLYAHHGPTGRERLPADRVRRLAARGEVHLLDALFSSPGADALHYLVELKCGHGPPEPPLTQLASLVHRHSHAGRVWVAASSLELLTAAQRAAPELPRVLFGAPIGKGTRLLHKPTTYIRRSLARHGLVVRLPAGTVQFLCLIGLFPRGPAGHARLAEAARRRGLAYLPGRVVRQETLAGLAASDVPGAFVYAAPESWSGTARTNVEDQSTKLRPCL